MITRYQVEMVVAGRYGDGDWVLYTDYIALEAELETALQRIEQLEADVQEYADAQPPI